MRLLKALLLWVAIYPAIGWAQNAQLSSGRDPLVIYFDDTAASRPVGLIGIITQLNPPGLGYQHFRIVFKRQNPSGSAVDTDIELALTLSGDYGSNSGGIARLTIPKYSANGTTDIFIPMPNTYNRLSFVTKVDGEINLDLSSFDTYLSNDYTKSSTVFIGDASSLMTIDNQTDIRLIGDDTSDAWTQAIEVRGSNSSNRNFDRVNIRFALIEDLPTNPLDWTTVNQVIASPELLSKLNDQQAECLLQYLRNFGSLLVYEDADTTQIQNSLSDWLGSHSQVSPENWRDLFAKSAVPNTLSVGLGEITIDQNRTLTQLLSYQNISILQFKNTPYGQQETRVERLRRQPFWNWYLTRLGQPPVGAFSLLIGLFAGVFAPALLIYCLRYNRTAWLLVVFPIIAIAGTLLMITYASVHDGFGTYSRVRSMTVLDQNSDQGICISRQVIFSGLTPREGLAFDKASEVWQLDAYESDYHSRLNSGTIKWTEDEQIYERLVTPREQFQFSLSQPVTQLRPFEWIQYPTTSADPNVLPTCEIKNLLEEDLQLVVISDGIGNFFMARNIAAGAASKMAHTDVSMAASALKALEDTQPLEMPPGLQNGPPQSIVHSLFGVRRYSGGFSSAQDVILNASNYLIDRNNLNTSKCFIVYPASGAYIDRALKNSNEKDSLHMIYGKWEKP
jgi:hypothetical protein